MKILINRCFGGYDFSHRAKVMLKIEYANDIKRTDPKAIAVVEELGEEANTPYSNLKVVDIPDTATDYEISEYDGSEMIICVIDGKIHHLF